MDLTKKVGIGIAIGLATFGLLTGCAKKEVPADAEWVCEKGYATQKKFGIGSWDQRDRPAIGLGNVYYLPMKCVNYPEYKAVELRIDDYTILPKKPREGENFSSDWREDGYLQEGEKNPVWNTTLKIFDFFDDGSIDKFEMYFFPCRYGDQKKISGFLTKNGHTIIFPDGSTNFLSDENAKAFAKTMKRDYKYFRSFFRSEIKK